MATAGSLIRRAPPASLPPPPRRPPPPEHRPPASSSRRPTPPSPNPNPSASKPSRSTDGTLAAPPKPELRSYAVDLNDRGPMILDALVKIKNEVDPTLTFRRSCAMNIDGDNGLACLTKIESESSASTVTPLPHVHVVKDPVVDMTNFYNQYKSVEPWLKRREEGEGGELFYGFLGVMQ